MAARQDGEGKNGEKPPTTPDVPLAKADAEAPPPPAETPKPAIIPKTPPVPSDSSIGYGWGDSGPTGKTRGGW